MIPGLPGCQKAKRLHHHIMNALAYGLCPHFCKELPSPGVDKSTWARFPASLPRFLRMHLFTCFSPLLQNFPTPFLVSPLVAGTIVITTFSFI